MITILKIQDQKDLNNGELHPITDLIFDKELEEAIDLDKVDQSLIGPKEVSLTLGFWRKGKHPRKRKIDFSPYYRMETTAKNDQFLLQRNENESFIFFWRRPEEDSAPEKKDIRGGIRIQGLLRLSFTENTRADFAYRKKIKDDFHIAPWKEIVILAEQFVNCPEPEDILKKNQVPKPPPKKRGRKPKAVDPNKPKRPRGRPRKNPLPE